MRALLGTLLFMSLQPTTTPGTRVLEDIDAQREPLFHLVLLDDDDHTYQYVIRMLGDIFGYSREKAFAIACMVDAQGRATLMTGAKSEVEVKQDAIHAYGPDPRLERSHGSMTAILEPVE
jgi:ATP-dependent Clp protease adaptor protein ClpS